MAPPRKHRVNPGDRFGMLEVIKESRDDQKGKWFAFCVCDCGENSLIRLDHLINGSTRSCGCVMRTFHITHNMTKSKEYRVYNSVVSRCMNPKDPAYNNYGGRGIECEWKSFENFYEDMGERPGDNFSIERLDTNKNYCKENCVWCPDRGLQNYNRRVTDRNTSGRVGVSETPAGNWVAEIRKDGKKIYLGTFKDFKEACRVRYEAEIKYYGFSATEGGSHD